MCSFTLVIWLTFVFPHDYEFSESRDFLCFLLCTYILYNALDIVDPQWVFEQMSGQHYQFILEMSFYTRILEQNGAESDLLRPFLGHQFTVRIQQCPQPYS